MEPRLARIRSCATSLDEPHLGGDLQTGCLVDATRAALEIAAEILSAQSDPTPRGYKAVCDKLAAVNIIEPALAERLKLVFDVAERMAGAWSSVVRDDLTRAVEIAPETLRAFADIAERWLLGGLPAAPT